MSRSHSIHHEPLEPRRMLSITPVPKTGRLNIVGSDGDDVVSLRAHEHLINLIVVSIRSTAGSERQLVLNGAIDRINISTGDGNDRVSIDKSLAGLRGEIDASIDLGNGNDTLDACTLDASVRMGAGDDSVSLADAKLKTGDLRIDAGDGADRLTLGAGKHVVNAGGGNDRIRMTENGFKSVDAGGGNDDVTLRDGGTVSGGAGNDRIVVDRDGGISPAALRGEAGNDTLVGGKGRDTIDGNAGDDRLFSGDSYGDELRGSSGNDVLDATDSDAATLYGGDGNDDLYVGEATAGIGNAGRDWFEPSDKWRWTDYDRDQDRRWGDPAKNTPSYGGGGYYGAIITNSNGLSYGSGSYYDSTYRLRALDDLGYLVVAAGLKSTGPSYGVIYRPTGTEYVESADGPTGRPIAPAGDYQNAAPNLTAAERQRVRPGIVRLSNNWVVSNPRPTSDGSLVWYEVRPAGTTLAEAAGNKSWRYEPVLGPDGKPTGESTAVPSRLPAYNAEFGSVFQLCVKRGTLIVTNRDKGNATPIARGRADQVVAMRIPASATARVAGQATTFAIADEVDSALVLDAKKGRRGVLVDGGVLWIGEAGGAAKFQSVKA